MTKLKQITCSIGRTINTGNFSSRKVEWTETYDVGPKFPEWRAREHVLEEVKEAFAIALKETERA